MNEYIKIALQANPAGLIAGFSQAEGAVQKFAAAFQVANATVQAGGNMYAEAQKSIRKMGVGIGGVSAGSAAYFALATKNAAGLQTQLKNVQSLTKVSNAELGEQGQGILEMSTKLPQSADELADGLYDISSSGFEGAAAMQILEHSSVAASAGMTSSAVATEAVVAALNAYGLSAAEAGDVSDTMFQTVNLGVIRFEELASGMGQWVGMASALGVEYDDAMAGIGTMTLAGIKPDQSATYLSRVMQSFLQTTELMESSVKDLGYSSAKAMLDANGLGESVLMLDGYTKSMAKTTGIDASVAFNDLFGSIQASRGAMAISANEGQNYARVASQITNETARAGAAQDAYAVQSESVSMKFKNLSNSLKANSITVGQYFLGPLGMALEMATKLSNTIFALPDGLKKLGAGFAVVGTAVGAALAGLMVLAPGMIISWIASIVAMKAAGVAAGLGMLKLAAGLKAVSTYLGIGKMISRIQKLGSFVMKFVRPLLTLPGMMASLGAFLAVESLFIFDGLEKAREEGERLAEVFTDGLDTSSFLKMKGALSELNDEITVSKEKLVELGDESQRTVGGNETADFLMGYVPFLGDAAQGRNEERTKQAAYVDGLEEDVNELNAMETRRKAMAFAGIAAANDRRVGVDYSSIQGPDAEPLTTTKRKGGDQKDLIGDNIEELNLSLLDAMDPYDIHFLEEDFDAQLESMSESTGRTVNGMMTDWSRLAEVEGFSMDDLDPETSDNAAENIQQVSDAYAHLSGMSPNMQEAKISFKEIASSADSAKSSIDKLGEALSKYIEASLGPMMARDALEGLVNDTYETVEDIKENSDLGEAMNFESFHEDAIDLRSNWANITQGMIEDTTAWAASQGEVTATDINQYLQDSIKRMRDYGAEMGLSSEFVERFVGDLQSVISNGDIDIAFNTNIADATGEVERFLITSGVAKMGDDPKVMTAEIEAKFRSTGTNMTEYLESIGAKDQQIDVIYQLLRVGAWDSLEETVDELTTADNLDVIQAVVDVKIQNEGAPLTEGDISGIADQFEDLDAGEVDLIVSAIGNGNDFLAITDMLATAVKEKEDLEIIADGSTIGPVNSQLATLNGLLTTAQGNSNINVQVNYNEGPKPAGITGITVPGKGLGGAAAGADPGTDMFGSIRRFAEGGVQETPGTANIYKPQTPYRIFAEPETGGEAYIPLAQNKRDRSLAILGSVAGMFGYQVTRYAEGGLAGRFRDDKDDKKDGGGGGSGGGKSKTAEAHEKAAEDQQKAADDQQKAAEDARKRERDVWNYKYEIDWSLGPIEYATNLLNQMSQLEAYSDEWMELGKEVHSMQDELQATGHAAQDFFHDADLIDESQFLGFLEGRVGEVRAFSAEWWDLGSQIVAQKRQIIEDQWDLEDTLDSTGNQSIRNRIVQLKERMAVEKKYSQEWWEVRNEVMDKQWDMYKLEVRYGKISNAEYVTFLEKRLTTVEKFSDSWSEIMDELNAIQSESLTKTADLFGTFNGRMALSSRSVIKFLERQITVATEFAQSIELIRSSGMFDPAFLQSLIDMGPSGLGLAGAIADAIGTGDASTIADLINQATDVGAINAASYDSGGYLPPGYTLAYNGTGQPERVGGGDTTVNVNVTGTFNNDNDMDRAAQRIKFALTEAS